MSGAYPPGVTGREDAFGPQAEMVRSMTCDNDDWKPRALSVDANEWIARLVTAAEIGADVDRMHALAAKVKKAVDECPTIDVGIDCGFDGDVDAQVWNHVVTATCPRCGGEIEKDVDEMFDDGPDPDDARDLAMEREWDRE